MQLSHGFCSKGTTLAGWSVVLCIQKELRWLLYLPLDKTALCQTIKVFAAAVDVHHSLILTDGSVDVMHEQPSEQSLHPSLEAFWGLLGIESEQRVTVLHKQA